MTQTINAQGNRPDEKIFPINRERWLGSNWNFVTWRDMQRPMPQQHSNTAHSNPFCGPSELFVLIIHFLDKRSSLSGFGDTKRNGLKALHVWKGAIREDSYSTILIRIKRLVNIICWILWTILCLAGHIPINDECIFQFYSKDVTVGPYGAGPAIPCIPYINHGLIQNINTRFTAGVFVCWGQ